MISKLNIDTLFSAILDGTETSEIANKLNEVIDELNRFESYTEAYMDGVNNLLEKPKESANSKEPIQYNDNTIQKDDKSIQYPFETRVGMLRQWLNEDRITEPDRMVTNEQIMVWLKKEHNFTLEHQGTDPEPLVITGKESYTIPPENKRYLTAEGWREYDGSKWV